MKTLLLILVAIIVSCNKQQEDTKVTRNSTVSGSVFSKWSLSNLPANLKISTEYSSDEISVIQDLEGLWEGALGQKINLLTTTATTTNKEYSTLDAYQDSEFGIYKTHKWPTSDLPAGALAITQIFGMRRNTGTSQEYIEITHADILVNYDYFTFSYNHASGTYDLKTVLLHEMGHFVGLYHNASDLSAVMYPYISSSTEKRKPYVADVDNLKSLYSISSATNALSAMDAPQAPNGVSIVSGNQQGGGVELAGPSIPARIIIELMANGTCNHRIDGKIVKHHSSEIKINK